MNPRLLHKLTIFSIRWAGLLWFDIGIQLGRGLRFGNENLN